MDKTEEYPIGKQQYDLLCILFKMYEKLEEKDFPFSELFLAARTLKDNNLEVLVLSLFFYSTKLVYYRREVVTFITKEGDRAYIYNVLGRFLSESKWFGQSNELREVMSCIPRYTDTCVLTSYIALYGKSIGVVVVMLLFGIFIKVLVDARKIDAVGK